jgi:hypothetical protein
MANENLGAAKRAKNDEFYTQFQDIEKEMNAYLEYNPDVFRNKTVLLPCDDPEWSNFTKYFAQNFEKLGLKKLMSTSYAPNSKPKDLNLQPTLFEIESPQYDETKTASNGKIFTLHRDRNGDKTINVNDLEWQYLEGDGDFRSEEITALRDQSDIIITNPPFSLFREFLAWIMEAEKTFVILGNMNAITYKEVFPLVQEDKLWLGVTRTGVGSMWFEVASGAPSKTGQREEGGKRYQTIGNSAWFTNLDHGRRHQPLPLMTEADNVKFSKHKEIRSTGYYRYENYDAIEVPYTDAIPSDFDGMMGVPITFLGKYSPEQFEILGMPRFFPTEGMSKAFVDAYYASGQTGQIAPGHPDAAYFDVNGRPVVPYRRIFIRHRRSGK